MVNYVSLLVEPFGITSLSNVVLLSYVCSCFCCWLHMFSKQFVWDAAARAKDSPCVPPLLIGTLPGMCWHLVAVFAGLKKCVLGCFKVDGLSRYSYVRTLPKENLLCSTRQIHKDCFNVHALKVTMA